MKRLIAIFLSVLLFVTISGQKKTSSLPELLGPISSAGTVFCAAVDDLTPFGYVEEEYFVKGNAMQFDFESTPSIAVPTIKYYPYKTRIIVRRPKTPDKFNGTVVVEWLNVSNMFDLDSDWWQLKKYIMRNGCIWVGVSAQKEGIHSQTGLKKWNPARYGTLDVTADSTLLNDELSFDIFSQIAGIFKNVSEFQSLKNYKTNVVIGSGHSQSAFFLTVFYNFIQSVTNAFDGFMIRGAGGKLKTDVNAKVLKINAETDLIELNQINERQPDTEHIVTWEIAGTSHADKTFLDDYAAICKRDFGHFDPYECDQPKCSLTPFHYGYASALNHVDKWIRNRVQPPKGIQIAVQEVEPRVIIQRDEYGNALGGIRLPQFDVPVSMNSGYNSGARSCRFYGAHQEFTQQTLKLLYPSHKNYMKKFKKSVKENLKTGYILKEDVPEMLNDAEKLDYLWE